MVRYSVYSIICSFLLNSPLAWSMLMDERYVEDSYRESTKIKPYSKEESSPDTVKKESKVHPLARKAIKELQGEAELFSGESEFEKAPQKEILGQIEDLKKITSEGGNKETKELIDEIVLRYVPMAIY